MAAVTLMIDNYDSFTWNVFQKLSNLLNEKNKLLLESQMSLEVVLVKRNNEISLEEAIALNPKRLVISPGPGYPKDAGVSMEFIRHFAGKIPILGVCLGEQCMYELYGGAVVPCGELIHGKTTPVLHDGRGLYAGVDQGIECTRYHSLAGDANTLPADELEITSWTESGIVMGVRHKKYVMEGVQFHPESIASEQGDLLFANFLSWTGGVWDELVVAPIPLPSKNEAAAAAEQDLKTVGKGIPLHMATKMNSTARSAVQPTTSSTESTSILQKIFNQRKKDVSLEKLPIANSMAYLERCYALNLAPPLIDFPSRLSASISKYNVAVLAEIKRASPSKGDIDAWVHAPQQALLYAAGGAAAISVLTEPRWFKGGLEDLRNVRVALDQVADRPAVLRKEFVFDEYQILQARLAGADTVLLIVAMLNDIVLAALMDYSRGLGMEPLVEVASVSEMERALEAGARVIGVNNRDLNTFTVDMNRTTSLSQMLSSSSSSPSTNSSIILLALSGIKNRADVETYLKAKVQGVLVGETLMKSSDKVQAVQHLLTGAPAIEEKRAASDEKQKIMAKICGLTNLNDARAAVSFGANCLGFIFAPNSPRCVDRATVCEITTSLGTNSGRRHLRTDTFSSLPVSAKDWFKTQKTLKGTLMFVGVFTSQTAHEINQITNECNLDLIQLHTPRSPAFHRLLNRPVIQVIGIQSSTTESDVKNYAKECAGSVSALLLDTTTSRVVGGSGQVFDWQIASKLDFPVWLAGGLTPENVSDACKIGHPALVDVCSGVEADGKKGVKDHAKMKMFLDAVSSCS